MSARLPLSQVKAAEHNSRKEKADNDALERRLKRALLGEAEQRRKRAEAEGTAEAARTEGEKAKEAARTLAKQLEQAKAELSQAKAGGAKPSKPSDIDLEIRLTDLVSRHKASKAKYIKDLEELRGRNDQLQQSIEELKAVRLNPDRGPTTEHGEARKAAEMVIRQLRKEAESSSATISGLQTELNGAKRERREWEDAEAQVERELKHSREETKALKVELETREGIAQQEMSRATEEREKLEEVMRECAVAHQLLYRNSVPRRTLAEVEERYHEVRAARLGLQSAAAISRRELEDERAVSRELKARSKVLQAEVDLLRDALEETQSQRERDRQQERVRPASSADYQACLEQDTVPKDVLDLVLQHQSLADIQYSITTADFADRLRAGSTDLTATQIALNNTEANHLILRSEHEKQQTTLEALQNLHSECASIGDELRAAGRKAEAEVTRQKVLVHENQRKILELEERSRADREGLKRALETAARGKSAEDALLNEIAGQVPRFRQALSDAEPYHDLYTELKEAYEILLSREAMTAGELERMGIQNAELVHANDGTKIGYIEGVRRETAIVKHELATTRHRLNAANDRILLLTNEIEAYKSIDLGVHGLASDGGLGGSMRTRVVRRQPEGSTVLGLSRSARTTR